MPNIIGYKLETAKRLLGSQNKITVEITETPFEDKKSERQNKEPVVVRQKEQNGEIILTVSRFK